MSHHRRVLSPLQTSRRRDVVVLVRDVTAHRQRCFPLPGVHGRPAGGVVVEIWLSPRGNLRRELPWTFFLVAVVTLKLRGFGGSGRGILLGGGCGVGGEVFHGSAAYQRRGTEVGRLFERKIKDIWFEVWKKVCWFLVRFARVGVCLNPVNFICNPYI